MASRVGPRTDSPGTDSLGGHRRRQTCDQRSRQRSPTPATIEPDHDGVKDPRPTRRPPRSLRRPGRCRRNGVHCAEQALGPLRSGGRSTVSLGCGVGDRRGSGCTLWRCAGPALPRQRGNPRIHADSDRARINLLGSSFARRSGSGCRRRICARPCRSAVCGPLAAHAMSPQLGTGASIGTADAFVLALLLRRHQPSEARSAYAKTRRAHWFITAGGRG